MVQFSYPGVYVEEKPSGVHTITGVSTSIAAFLGQASQGPINKPVRILSFANFEKIFGKTTPAGDLSMAVRLFFQNGGSDCYVVRLVETGSGSKASLILKNQDKTIPILKFVAKEIGTWGNEIAVEIDYNTPTPGDTFHIRILRIGLDGTILEDEKFINCSMDPDSPRFPPKLISQNSKFSDCELQLSLDDYKTDVKNKIALSEGRKLLRTGNDGISDLKDALNNLDPVKFGVSVDNNPPYEVSISKSEYSAVTSQQDFENMLNPKFNESNVPAHLRGAIKVVFRNIVGSSNMVMRFETESNSGFKKVSIVPGSSNDITKALMLGRSQGGIEESSHAFYQPAPNGIFFDTNNGNLDNLSVIQQDFFDTVMLNGNPIELGTKLQTTGANDFWYQANSSQPNTDDGIREKFSIIAEEINLQLPGWNATIAGSRLLIKKKGGPANDIPTISTELSSPSTPNNIGSFFQTNSRLYILGSPPSAFTEEPHVGSEGRPPKLNDYIGNEMEHTGLYSLDSVDLFNILVIPDDKVALVDDEDYMGLWAPASVYCEQHNAFLLVGPPRQWSQLKAPEILTNNSKGILSLRKGIALEHAAVYYPRILVPENGLLRSVDPCGAMAGIMARTDDTSGVWKAPAGLKADLQGGSFDLETVLSDDENGILNKEAINCLRLFPIGLVCWGARTMAGADDNDTEKKYVSLTRFIDFVKISLYRGTKFAVFELNNEQLWAQLRNSITTFLRSLFRAGALQGRTEAEAFIVICDNETTTDYDQKRGIVNIEVYLRTNQTAEFIHITLQQKAGEI